MIKSINPSNYRGMHLTPKTISRKRKKDNAPAERVEYHCKRIAREKEILEKYKLGLGCPATIAEIILGIEK